MHLRVGVFNKWKLLFSGIGVTVVLCGMAILAMVVHGLEARATLHEYALADGIRELFKRNDKRPLRSFAYKTPQDQFSLFNL